MAVKKFSSALLGKVINRHRFARAIRAASIKCSGILIREIGSIASKARGYAAIRAASTESKAIMTQEPEGTGLIHRLV